MKLASELIAVWALVVSALLSIYQLGYRRGVAYASAQWQPLASRACAAVQEELDALRTKAHNHISETIVLIAAQDAATQSEIDRLTALVDRKLAVYHDR
jgi:hypothetical protein